VVHTGKVVRNLLLLLLLVISPMLPLLRIVPVREQELNAQCQVVAAPIPLRQFSEIKQAL
jgi:hypothetical protein